MTSNIVFELVGHSTYHVKHDGEFVGIVQKSMTGGRWKCGCPSLDMWFESRERAAAVLIAIADAIQAHRPDVDAAIMKIYTLRTPSGHPATQVAKSAAEARRLVGIKGAVVTSWRPKDSSESMVSTEFYREMQQERDALQARVEQLQQQAGL